MTYNVLSRTLNPTHSLGHGGTNILRRYGLIKKEDRRTLNIDVDIVQVIQERRHSHFVRVARMNSEPYSNVSCMDIRAGNNRFGKGIDSAEQIESNFHRVRFAGPLLSNKLPLHLRDSELSLLEFHRLRDEDAPV